MTGEGAMLSQGSKSNGAIACLLASCASSARWALLAAFAAVLVFSARLSIFSNRTLASRSSFKAPISIAKTKALSTSSARFASSCRTTHGRLTRRPSLLSIPAPSDDRPQSIFRPLRC
jgi:hypothetical protein